MCRVAIEVIRTVETAWIRNSWGTSYEKAIRGSAAGTNFSVISENPLFIIDGAHNEGAALRLKETIELYLQIKELSI